MCHWECSQVAVILVVSHNPELADARRERLEAAGHTVVAARDVVSIRQGCKEAHIDLAVIGYSLPPAEQRRVSLEIRQHCVRNVAILQLERKAAGTSVKSSASQHAPELDSLTEQVRRLLSA